MSIMTNYDHSVILDSLLKVNRQLERISYMETSFDGEGVLNELKDLAQSIIDKIDEIEVREIEYE